MKRINDLGIAGKIRILDSVPRNELPNYIKMADCVVVPSLTEGFGFAVAESCAMGKVVVASDTKSIPEVISGEYVLVKPKNPKDIARGVIDAHKMKVTKTKLKRFLWSDSINAYQKIYEELIRKKK